MTVSRDRKAYRKRKNLLVTILLLVLAVSGFSQNSEFTYPNFIGQELHSVENDNDWDVLQKASGDLNKDGKIDYALILESKDSVPEKRCSNCHLTKNKPRIILILLDQDKSQKVVIQNNRFIARGDEGGMAYYIEPELSIKDGLLNVYYQYTRSNQSYTFEYNNGRMEILYAESNGVHSASGNFENEKYDFKKGKIISETGNISQEKVETEITTIDIQPKSLSEFEEMYQWQIAEHKYL